MIRKYMLILFFCMGSLTFGFPSFAETSDGKNMEEMNGKQPVGNLKEQRPQAVKDLDILEKQPKQQKKGKKPKAPPMPEELEDDLNCTKDMQYTEAQKKKLDEIYHKIYMDYLELIETYTAAGALTEEQKLVRYSMLKNYILTFAKRNYKWCSEWEEDEWEEEWYNIDRD